MKLVARAILYGAAAAAIIFILGVPTWMGAQEFNSWLDAVSMMLCIIAGICALLGAFMWLVKKAGW